MPVPFLLVLLAEALFFLVYWRTVFLLPNARSIELAQYGMLAAEIVFHTTMVYFLGTVSWLGAFAYVFGLIFTNTFLDMRRAFIYTSAASLAFASLILLEATATIPHYIYLDQGPLRYTDARYVATTLIAGAGVFFSIYLWVNWVGRQLRQERDAAIRTQDELFQARAALQRTNDQLEERVRERTALYKLANAALHASEERLRTVIGNAPVVLFALDGEGIITLAEGKGLDDLGIAPDELIGRPVFDLLSSQPEVHKSVRDALAGEPATIIVGGNSTFEARLSPVRDENDNLTGVIGVATDITERKQAEEALRESEGVLKAIVESTADGILVVNNDGRVIYANEQFAEMWRIPDRLLEARDDEKLLSHVVDQLKNPEEFLAKVQELYQTSQEDSEVLSFKDGRVFERFSRPLLTGSDSAGRVWSFRDVTEQKQVLDTLRDAANHDPLTGLLNRRAGNAAIKERLAEAQSNDKSFAMMVLDLDKFKSINDSFGHETGDAALVQFADVLSELVGESGIVCRIGGDEFGVGMEDVDEDQAFSFARRVQTSLRHALASSDTELRPRFTVSIGIACYPDDGENVSILGRRADRAMYEAKVAGCDTSRAWRQIDSSQAA